MIVKKLKKIFIYTILGLFFCNISFSEKLTNVELFGVEILQNIKKYGNIEDGKVYEHLPNVITYRDSDLKINRSDEFDFYYIRTFTNHKIQNITGQKIYLTEFSNFNNQCLKDKDNIINGKFSSFTTDNNKFYEKYWKDKRNDMIYNASNINLIVNNQKSILSAYCGYTERKGKLLSILFVSLLSDEYYQKHVKGRWENINVFDEKFIINHLKKPI